MGMSDQDMRILEVKNWKKAALDRDKRAKLLKKARARLRAVEPMMLMECPLRHSKRHNISVHINLQQNR
jgi:hypothetical protein